MSIHFGVASLKSYRNGWETGLTVTSGGGGTGIDLSSGSVWLDGRSCVVSATNISVGAGQTGTGGWVYSYLPSGNSSTAATTATMTDPTGTVYALIGRFSFGTANDVDLLTGSMDVSAKTALISFARAHNVTINITYDQAVARGGTLVFGNDMKMYNGAIEGNAEYGELDPEALSRLMGGSYASGGASSGTWSVSATTKPLPFMLQAQTVTDGNTATFKLLKCHSTQIALPFDREGYLVPNINFVAVANAEGDIIEIED